MTSSPFRKLFSVPLLVGIFFLCFLGAATLLIIHPGPANPQLAILLSGTALAGMAAIKSLWTRAKDTELALAEGERYIEAVAELSQDVHAILDTRSRGFLYVNPAVETLLGFPLDAFQKGGLDYFHSLVHPADLPVLKRQYELLLEPREPRDLKEPEPVQDQTFRIRNNHGEYRWFRSRRTVFVRYGDGQPAEFLAVVQDVTQQRSYEAALVEAQKAESLGALTRGTVHDLNNTLMGIQGYADLALEGTGRPEVLRRNLDAVQASVQRASALCRQMLAYTGQSRVQMAPKQLNDVIMDSLPAIESLLPEGGHLALELESDLPLVSLDLNQARYVLLNLTFNAVGAVGIEGGEIAIGTRLRHLDGHDPAAPGLKGDFVCLEVRHSGPALSQEALDHIYDPLYATQGPGPGLGLSAVQGILAEHQGATHAAGNHTELLFPLAEKVPALDAGDEGTPVAGAAGVILLVDDEPTIRAILRMGLEGAGYKVIEAVDGVDGFGAFVRHRSSISAVLLDLTMPRMGGDEVFEEIHKLAPELPVILMSGYSRQEAEATLSTPAIAGFLPKPCSIKEALAVLRAALA